VTGDISQHPACPKINHVIMLNKMSGSLASLSMIRLASKILCQSDCHLRWLCVSVDTLLYWAVLPPNFVAKVADTLFDNVTELLPYCWAWHREMTNYCLAVEHGTER
jgi:hypothetical protein